MNANRPTHSPLYKILILLLFFVSACAPKQISVPTSRATPLIEPTTTPTQAAHGQSTGARIPTHVAENSSLSDPEEKLLLKVDSSVDTENIYQQLMISPDAQHAAYFLQKENSYIFIVDGKQWQPVESAHAPAFSSDGSRVALAASINGEWHMIINDCAGPAYESMGHPVFSPDGTRLAYSVKKDGKWYMIVDGVMSVPYDNLGLEPGSLGSFQYNTYGIPPVFSPDSKRVAYVAQNGLQQFVVIDGEAGKPYQQIVSDGDVNDAFELAVTQSPIVFSPNSQHFAYIAQQQDGLHIVVDGKGQLFPYEKYHLSSLAFSPDSQNLAFIAGQGEKFFVVMNGKKQKPFTKILYFVFSPDSKHIAYSAEQGTKWYVIVDGKESLAYDHIMGAFYEEGSPPVFSPDSQRVAFEAWKGDKVFTVVDGQEGEPYDDSGVPRFSPDSKRIVNPVKTGNQVFVAIDGILGNSYDNIGPFVPTAYGYFSGSPIFNQDSSHVAYAAQRSDKWIVVVDGKETESCDLVFAISFSDPETVYYMIQKDHDIYLVTQKLD